MESTRGNTHSVTFFPPGNVFFGSMISTMHPLTTNTAAVLRQERDTQVENLCYGGQRGAARAREPALLTSEAMDGGAKSASSE